MADVAQQELSPYESLSPQKRDELADTLARVLAGMTD